MMNIHVSKLTEYTTPRINPNVNNGLWVVTKCRSRLINFNKCPTLVRDTDCGGGIWELSVISPQFCCSLNYSKK